MSRPSTQRRGRNHDGVLTDDDFLFVPPATASSSRSPRTARGPSHGEKLRTTVVGVGTVGLGERGCKMEAPANVHREWLRLKKSRSPPPDFELPTLSPREQFEQRKVSRTQKLSAKEEYEENLARKCADEKKSRINEAKAIKADVETFTKTYVQDLVEREREGRERAKRARDEELKLHEQWCHNMAAARRAHDPAVASARRQAALEASYRTRHLIEELVKEAHPDEKSPPRVHAREVSDVRKAVLADHHLWEEMKESQTIADRELQHAKRTHVKAIHNTMKDSVSAEYTRRHETAESQRKSISEYRELWEKEASKWRNGLNESVKADRESHVKAISKRAELLQRHAEEENEAGVKLREALRAQRLKNKEEHEELNRQRAATVRQTTQLTLSAREALIEKNRRAFLDTKAESERRAALKQRDKEEDFSTRKALHDEEAQRARSPKSPRPTTSGSNQRTPAPPGTAPAGSARRPTTQGQAQE